MIVHELKSWPHYFRPTWDGEKLADVRYDDRGFQRGDIVIIREWDREGTCTCRGSDHTKDCTRYTGREVVAEIGYVMASTPGRGSRRGFTGDGYVVLSLINLDRVDANDTEGARPTAHPFGGITVADVKAAGDRVKAAVDRMNAATKAHRAEGGVIPTPRPPGDTS